MTEQAEPRGVTFHAALATLTKPGLFAARLNAELESWRLPPAPSRPPESFSVSELYPMGGRLPFSEEERRKHHVAPYSKALHSDFRQRVKDGRIVASWIDLTRPAEGARDYPGEVAALIVWQGNLPKLGQNGPVLADLRYRRAAGEVAPAPLVYPAHAPKGGSGKRYTAKALGAWFVHREGTWKIENPEAPYPNRARDLAAADSYFSGRIPPDEFRRIRKEKTSEDWRKRGPRGPFPKPSSDE